MIEWFLSIDEQIFRFINQSLASGLCDVIFGSITNVKYWIPLYIISLGLLVWKGGRKGRECVILLLLFVGISDNFNSRVLKPAFHRDRPSTRLNDVRVVVPAHGMSFPSTHSTNNFGAALILSFFFRRRASLWFAIAALIGFSRVYVGAHYPSDVVAGAVEGSLIAMLLVYTYARFFVGRRLGYSKSAKQEDVKT